MSKDRENKTGVLIFRLPTSDDNKLGTKLSKNPIIGIKSKNLFARKIILDYLHGRLIYLDPAAATDNPLIKETGTSKH
jgi:hypothetical protein